MSFNVLHEDFMPNNSSNGPNRDSDREIIQLLSVLCSKKNIRKRVR